MSDEVAIRPRTVEHEHAVVVTYQSPKAVTNAEEPYGHRSFTMAEMEDILIHARANDAEDDTLIDIDTWRNQATLRVTLPKHWADISTPPVGRNAPVHVQFWHGWRCGVLFAGIVSFLSILIAVTGP